ncbi:MAG: hypothetical protein AAFZ18_15035 [Myxococcota bacterium]
MDLSKLRQFLEERFAVDELAPILQDLLGANHADLPSRKSTRSHYVAGATRVLERNGLIGDELKRRLKAERKNFEEEIETIFADLEMPTPARRPMNAMPRWALVAAGLSAATGLGVTIVWGNGREPSQTRSPSVQTSTRPLFFEPALSEEELSIYRLTQDLLEIRQVYDQYLKTASRVSEEVRVADRAPIMNELARIGKEAKNVEPSNETVSALYQVKRYEVISLANILWLELSKKPRSRSRMILALAAARRAVSLITWMKTDGQAEARIREQLALLRETNEEAQVSWYVVHAKALLVEHDPGQACQVKTEVREFEDAFAEYSPTRLLKRDATIQYALDRAKEEDCS